MILTLDTQDFVSLLSKFKNKLTSWPQICLLSRNTHHQQVNSHHPPHCLFVNLRPLWWLKGWHPRHCGWCKQKLRQTIRQCPTIHQTKPTCTTDIQLNKDDHPESRRRRQWRWGIEWGGRKAQQSLQACSWKCAEEEKIVKMTKSWGGVSTGNAGAAVSSNLFAAVKLDCFHNGCYTHIGNTSEGGWQGQGCVQGRIWISSSPDYHDFWIW